MADSAPSRPYPVLPLRDIVLFPGVVAPLVVGRKKSVLALEYATERRSEIFLVTQKVAAIDDPGADDLYGTGTLAQVMQILRLPDGSTKALVEGRRRGLVRSFLPTDSFLFAEVVVPEVIPPSSEAERQACMRSLVTAFGKYAEVNKKISAEVLKSLAGVADVSLVLDIAAAHMPFPVQTKQELLVETGIAPRLEFLLGAIQREMEIAALEQSIHSRVKKRLGKNQRDYYLGEQMRVIKQEMGLSEDSADEIAALEKLAKKKRLPRLVYTRVLKELKKLKSMPPMSAETTVLRNYVDCVLALPWNTRSKSELDLALAEKVLNEEHFGLKKAKDRILEYLAVQAQVGRVRGQILCLVGPPGVGKTSLCRSIATALKRNFVRLSLGGVRDEAEIRGHRRTYIGALPGKILQSMQRAGVVNPLFCLDEIDKMNTDFRGDPSAALLEVLDPEQNSTFNDHYLALDYDLSEVMFITTANTLLAIPPPLQDRMEIIHLSGYTEDDKLSIARDHLVPRQTETHGFASGRIRFSADALLAMIRLYTREAGVRNLERAIATVCRKIARRQLSMKPEKPRLFRVGPRQLAAYLGVPKFRFGQVEAGDTTGLATGLAWTEAGGELLQIEAALMPGKGTLTITGKLGEVMQESAQAALSYVRSRSLKLGLAADFYQKVDIHLHVPEGAIPKDGPSAGITMAVAMVSALLRLPVRSDLAMTGEITLRGRILPIGGLAEKLLAARRAGIRRVLIPRENERNLEDLPARIRKSVEIELVEHMDAVLEKSLVLEEGRQLFQEVPMEALYRERAMPLADTAH